jgi:hypothetical protein
VTCRVAGNQFSYAPPDDGRRFVINAQSTPARPTLDLIRGIGLRFLHDADVSDQVPPFGRLARSAFFRRPHSVERQVLCSKV